MPIRRNSALVILALALGASAAPAYARKESETVPIAAIFSHPTAKETLGDFKFVFGNKVAGVGLGVSTSRQATNGVGKSDANACVWAALGALKKMKADAIARGGRAVEGIVSFVDGADFSSTSEFKCISGFTNSRVYFRGTVVR